MEYHNKMYQSMINRSFIFILYIVDFSQVNPFSKYDDRNIPFLHKYNQGSYKKSKMVHSIHTWQILQVQIREKTNCLMCDCSYLRRKCKNSYKCLTSDYLFTTYRKDTFITYDDMLKAIL